MFRIRRTKDIEACHKMHRELFPADALYEADDAAWWLVADVGYEDVAFAAARLIDGDSVFMARCGVKECARGQGLQRRLLRVREQYARQLGAKWAVTYVDKYNPASGNNLFAAGYKLYVPAWKWAHKDALYFRKAL